MTKIDTASVVYISGDALCLARPDAEEVYVLHWDAAGIVIPWPKGLTIKKAIIEWAKFQIRMNEGSRYKPNR